VKRQPPDEALSAEAFRRHALEDVLPHWYEHALDRECGGYIPQLDRQWRVTDPDRKSLVATTRLVYNFSQGRLLGGSEWCSEAARHGLDFLLGKFWDTEHDGWFWEVDRRGEPIEPHKGTYGHAFAILSLSEYARAFGDERALDMARRTFNVLEERVYDAERGGYRERFRRDWTGPDPMRTQNSQMHLVEALLALGEVSGEARYLDRALKLCRLMDRKLFDHAHGCLPEFFHDDWSDFPEHRGDSVQPGHQMEWAWLLLRVHGHRPQDWLVERAEQMMDFGLRHGWDEEFGGFYTDLSRTGEVTNAAKLFWPQCEGVMAPLWLWRHTGDDEYWAAFELAARYCFEHFVDREYGGWFGELTRENAPKSTAKGGPWRADYHVVQMCAEVWRFLSGREGGAR